MRLALLATLTAAGLSAPAALAQARDVVADVPFDVSVTVYRDPYRDEGGFDLDDLQGFALITESRRVVLEPGEQRLRFEGVADGIEPASAIVTGLPSGVVEKNRDAMLLSPSALVASAQGQGGRVQLLRTDPATGAMMRSEGTIRSEENGVVFESSIGIEALRCSGLAETFSFDSSTTGLSALPTLSVLTRTTERVEAVVQLSYLSRGFDWAADYTVDMTSNGKANVGAWVTLANGNGTAFRDARVQIVAGRLNKESGDVEPIDIGQPILAYCWPRGSTSDSVPPIRIARAFPLGFGDDLAVEVYATQEGERVVVTGSMIRGTPEDAALPVMAYEVTQEELGDLKLYRVPERTTVASRQSKQVRLMDRASVPMTRIYEADFYDSDYSEYEPMTILLRTRNDKKNNLGIPLPSGAVYVRETVGAGSGAQQLVSAAGGLRDTAVDEETELRLTDSADVQMRHIREQYEITGPARRAPPLLPGISLRLRPPARETNRIEITNARPFAIRAEVRLDLEDGEQLVSADKPVGQKNGRPVFRVAVPANSTLRIRYQTAFR